VPRDNPLVNRGGAQPEIGSYGHHTVQGAASIYKPAGFGRSNAARAAVQQGPEGMIYLVTDSRSGRVLRVLPAAR
jgi:hypothetical protein